MKRASLVDEFIAAKVAHRFASEHTKKADVNSYPEKMQALKATDALLAGLTSTTKKFSSASKEGLETFAKGIEELPGELEKLGVNTKSLKRYFTQIENLIKVAQKGDPLRAYSTYKSDTPIAKAQKVLQTLAQAAMKASGAGSLSIKPVFVSDIFKKKVVPGFQQVMSACDSWYKEASSASSDIGAYMAEAHVYREPFRSGFGDSPDFEAYAAAQRDFSDESESLRKTIQHNAIGLPLASSGFEDCLDPDLCLKTLSKSTNEMIKLHSDFHKKWGDFRAKHQSEFDGQKSLF